MLSSTAASPLPSGIADTPSADRPLTRRLFAAFLVTYLALSSGHLYTMDDHTQFETLHALWTQGTAAIEIPASQRHLNTSPGRDGRHYSYYPVGGILVYAPFYLFGHTLGAMVGRDHYVTQASMSLVNAFATAWAAVLLFVLLRREGRGRREALWASCAYGLASCALVWAKAQYTSVWIGTLLLWMIVLVAEGSRRGAFFAGVIGGLAIACRYDALLPCLLLGTIPLMEKRPRDGAVMAIGFVPFLALTALWNTMRFGAPWTTGYPEIAGGHAFATPSLDTLAGLIVLPGRGLIWYSPLVLLVPLARRVPLTARTLVAHILLPLGIWVFSASYLVWHGASAWGPRLLAPALPCLAWWFGWMVLPRSGIRRAGVLAIVAVSVAIQLWGSTVSVDSYHDELVERGIDPMRSATEPALSPLWGIRIVANDFHWEPLERALPQSGGLPAGGHQATVNLRHTPDFWPFYAWKVGVPAWMAAGSWLALAAVAAWIWRGIVRAC